MTESSVFQQKNAGKIFFLFKAPTLQSLTLRVVILAGTLLNLKWAFFYLKIGMLSTSNIILPILNKGNFNDF